MRINKLTQLIRLRSRWSQMQTVIADPETSADQVAEAQRIAARCVKMRDWLVQHQGAVAKPH